MGVFYAISTLLSQMILAFYKDAQELIGTIGLLIVVSGMVGSIICGYILDKFHHYKLVIFKKTSLFLIIKSNNTYT